jgi:hypothetical protein
MCHICAERNRAHGHTGAPVRTLEMMSAAGRSSSSASTHQFCVGVIALVANHGAHDRPVLLFHVLLNKIWMLEFGRAAMTVRPITS